MKQLSVILMLVLILSVSQVFAQPTAIISPVGVSPRDVAADAEDMYTRTSSGLANVGVGEMVYLAGNPGDDAITAWAWQLSVPNGSNSSLSANDAAVVTFVPDRVGTFRVTLTVTSDAGQSEAVNLAINSANYVGIGGISGQGQVPQCIVCHAEKTEDWHATKHSGAFSRGIDGISSDHFGSRCVSCHVTGYDATEGAVNGGFDDVAADEGWAFPDTTVAGNWDNMVQNHPRTAGLANIQCESCHGPGSAHMGQTADNKMVSSLETGACAKCHDSGTHHVFPYQWDNSGHASVTRSPSGPGRQGCVRCHTGAGFVQYLNGVPQEEVDPTYMPITCASCHDPHVNEGEHHQLRTVEAYTFENGVEADLGYGNLCINCHHSRRNAEVYVQRYASHFGPHYSNQGDMVYGTNAIEYGMDLPLGPHRMVENVCIGCHMAEGPTDVNDPGYAKLGDHSFAMVTADGVEHVETCTQCHGEIESFEEIVAGMDYDSDGSREPVVEEIEGLLHTLGMMLPPYGDPAVTVDTTYNAAQLKAAYNFFFVEEDGSHGIHNARYAAAILRASINDEGLRVGDDAPNMPYLWSLDPAYPNPFNPSTTIGYTVAKATNLTLKLYDVNGRFISTLADGFSQAGKYKATIMMTEQPSGVYFVNLEAEGFSARQKVILMK